MPTPAAEGLGLSKHPNASSGYPSLYFINDEGTGLGSTATNTLDFFANYTKVYSLTSTALTVAASKTLAVTDADKLTVGGIIVPQTLTASVFMPGTTPATAANYGVVFFTAPWACKVVSVKERHATAGNDAGAVTIMLKKVPSGTAAASGTDCLSAGISLKATTDTNQAGTLHGTPENYTLAAGDSLAIVLTGTPTSVAGLGVTVEYQRV